MPLNDTEAAAAGAAMTYEVLVRFAPETSAARLNDERREGLTLYNSTQMRIKPSETTVLLS